MKLKLVEDWKKAYKWLSVQFMALLLVLPEAWQYVPPGVKEALPPHFLSGLSTAIVVAAILGRMIHQGETPKDDKEPDK